MSSFAAMPAEQFIIIKVRKIFKSGSFFFKELFFCVLGKRIVDFCEHMFIILDIRTNVLGWRARIISKLRGICINRRINSRRIMNRNLQESTV